MLLLDRSMQCKKKYEENVYHYMMIMEFKSFIFWSNTFFTVPLLFYLILL